MLVTDFSRASGDNKMLKYNASASAPNICKLKIPSPQSSLFILHIFVKRFHLLGILVQIYHIKLKYMFFTLTLY